MRRVIGGRGLVHVYTGDGKGKTTAALGLALRMLGWGGAVCMVQFIKGYAEIGERKFAADFGDRFEIVQFADDDSMAIGADKVLQRRKQARAALEYAGEAVRGGRFDMVVLDEANNALDFGLIAVEELLALLDARSEGVEIVLTGRGAPEAVIEAADYVTEMKLIAHPFDAGAPARRGVDY